MCAYLRSMIFPFKQQIVIVDACSSIYESFDWRQELAGQFNKLEAGSAEQFVVYGSSPGQAASEKGGKSVFFEALLPMLKNGANWPPNIEAITEDLDHLG